MQQKPLIIINFYEPNEQHRDIYKQIDRNRLMTQIDVSYKRFINVTSMNTEKNEENDTMSEAIEEATKRAALDFLPSKPRQQLEIAYSRYF